MEFCEPTPAAATATTTTAPKTIIPYTEAEIRAFRESLPEGKVTNHTQAQSFSIKLKLKESLRHDEFTPVEMWAYNDIPFWELHADPANLQRFMASVADPYKLWKAYLAAFDYGYVDLFLALVKQVIVMQYPIGYVGLGIYYATIMDDMDKCELMLKIAAAKKVKIAIYNIAVTLTEKENYKDAAVIYEKLLADLHATTAATALEVDDPNKIYTIGEYLLEPIIVNLAICHIILNNQAKAVKLIIQGLQHNSETCYKLLKCFELTDLGEEINEETSMYILLHKVTPKSELISKILQDIHPMVNKSVAETKHMLKFMNDDKTINCVVDTSYDYIMTTEDCLELDQAVRTQLDTRQLHLSEEQIQTLVTNCLYRAVSAAIDIDEADTTTANP